MKLPECPRCGRNSIIGIHAGATCGPRVLLHNYQCSCGYDTGNFIDDSDARKKLRDDLKERKLKDEVKN